MSRSYHVTERKAKVAFYQGNTDPSYLVSEKSWVKKQAKTARESKQTISNRAIVGDEKKRTARARRKTPMG
jgi:hypothetical protein